MLGVGDIFILLLYVLSRFHELGHFVAVEYLFLLFGVSATLGGVGVVSALGVVHFLVHLLLYLAGGEVRVGVGVDLAELVEEVVAGGEVLEEVVVFGAGRVSEIQKVHLINYTRIIGA
jgi:hypothetical protein